MRRHDRTGTTRAERGLLHGYWMLSGYGLRASRALYWLAATMLVTIVLLMGFGLPEADPKQEATGIVPPSGGKVTFEIDKADPQNPQRTGSPANASKSPDRHTRIRGLPLLRPGPDHHWHLHRDGIAPDRARSSGPGCPGRP